MKLFGKNSKDAKASQGEDRPRARKLAGAEIRAAQRHLLFYIGKRKAGWFWAVVCIIAAALTSLAALSFIAPLLRSLNDNSASQALTLNYLLIMVGLTILGTLLLWLGRAVMARLAQDMVVDIRTDYYAALMRQTPAFYRKREVGELVAVGMNDSEAIGAFFTGEVPYALFSVARVVVSLGFMASFSYQLALGSVLAVAVVQGLVIAIILPLIQRLAAKHQQELASVNSELSENLSNVRDIQVFTQEERTTNEFRRQLLKLAGYVARNMNLTAITVAAAYFLNILGPAAGIGVGILLVLRGDLEAEAVISFSAYVTQFVGPILTLNETAVRVQSLYVAANRMFGIMDIPPDIQDKPGAVDPGPLRGHIKFENVSFSYEPSDPAAWRVKNINLEILPGEKVAFVGGSGSGKSTLLYLALRFYDVTEGRVTIDGYDVRDLQLQALRRNFGVVAQNAGLFQGTVADNIRFGNPDADASAIKAAAAVGYVTEFIEKLDRGYETVLGEMGQGLSGGQKQRVVIARAALSKPSILILDEATSALDNQSEAIVMKSLKKLGEGCTTLAIAHRLNTIIDSDKIVLMSADAEGHGVIRAVGRHDELLEKSDEYYTLYSTKAARKSILMPIGPLYNTVPVLPTAIGLARAYNAPVHLLDFGTVTADEVRTGRYGVKSSTEAGDTAEINRAHMQRVEGLRSLFKNEGIELHVIQPAIHTDWIDATLDAIDRTQATHYVAMENVLVPLEELRESIRKIERKGTIEYILVDPTVGLQQGEHQPLADVRGIDPSVLSTVGRKFKLPKELVEQAEALVKAGTKSLKLVPQLKQFTAPATLIMFAWPALWLALLLFAAYPFLLNLGWPAPAAFISITALGGAAELLAGLILAKREGFDLRARLGLEWAWPNSQREWLIFAGATAAVLLIPVLASPLDRLLFPVPAWAPDLFSFPVWAVLLVAQLVGPLFVVFGEEVYYRGYLQPKMKAAFGSNDWLFNAGLFVLKQAYQPWLAFRPGNIVAAFTFAYYGRKRQVWLSVVLHYLSYLVLLVLLSG
jgi:subfamily B ATP-binding cassette protein MsbA